MKTETFTYTYTGDNPGTVKILGFPSKEEWLSMSPEEGLKLRWAASEHLKLRMFQTARRAGETEKFTQKLSDFKIPDGADPDAKVRKLKSGDTAAELRRAAEELESEELAKAAAKAVAAAKAKADAENAEDAEADLEEEEGSES